MHERGEKSELQKGHSTLRSSLDGTAWIACVAKQQEAEVCVSSFHGMLDSRRLLSHELLVPAAYTHTVEVPPGDQGVGERHYDYGDLGGNSRGCL